MSINFLQLPEEILLKILKHSFIDTLVNVNQTCQTLKRITNAESLWKFLCQRDYGVHTLGTNYESYSSLYKEFLHRFGHLLGTYMLNIEEFGGFVEIEFDDGLNAWEWRRNSKAANNCFLERRCLFRMTQNGKAIVVNCTPYHSPHECKIKKSKVSRYFQLKCCDLQKHDYNIGEQNSFNPLYVAYYGLQLSSGISLLPLQFPSKSDIPKAITASNGVVLPVIVEPGLFSGVYETVGSDFIIFNYYNALELHGFKIFGDDNLTRAGPKTIKVLLRNSLALNKENQMSYKLLTSENTSSVVQSSPDLVEQNFYLPPDTTNLGGFSYPNKCKARYLGYGKAKSLYQNPLMGNYEQIHFVVFNEDQVGVLWVNRKIFKVYERVEKEFTKHRGHEKIFIK